VKIIFLAGGEVYEILYAEPGKEAILNLLLARPEQEPPVRLVILEDAALLICLPSQTCVHTACWIVMAIFNTFRNVCKRTDAKSASVQ